MVLPQKKTIQIIVFYILTVIILVKSKCHLSTILRQENMFLVRGKTNLTCENVTFHNADLFNTILGNSTKYPLEDFPEFFRSYLMVDHAILNSLTISNSNVSFNSNAFQNFSNLKSLDITSSSLSLFDIEPMPNLTQLNLSNNSLTTLNLNGFNLTHLNISYNKISSISCLNVSKIIDLSHNELKEVCRFAPTIEYIDLSYNNITSYGLNNLSFLNHLQELDLSYNNIRYLHGQLEDLKVLQVLNLSHNSLKILSSNCFETLNSLRILDLSFNQIEKIYYGSFKDLIKLARIDLSYNNIYDLDVTKFYSLLQLVSLQLKGNVLHELDVDTLTKILKYLQFVSISFSEISCVKLTHYINLFRKYLVTVEKGPAKFEHNVHGIHCTPLNNTKLFKDNFEFTMYGAKKTHTLLVVVTLMFILIFCMLFAINFYRYKSLRRLQNV